MRWGRLIGTGGASQEADPNPAPPSVLGPAITVHGRLDAEGDLYVHGAVVGEVCAAKVILAVEGYIEGDVLAHEVELHGHVRGRVTAPVVAVEATAVIEGTVLHHRLAMADGAFVDGFMPWRPMNYFHEATEQGQGDSYEHVYEKR